MKIEKHGDYQMLVDDAGHVVYPPVAEKIQDVGENLFAVYYSGKVGIIRADGRSLVPMEYDDCGKFSHGLIKLEKGFSFYFFNKAGKLIYLVTGADYVTDFDGEKISITNYDEDPYTHERQIAYGDVYIPSIKQPYFDYDSMKRTKSKNEDKEDSTKETYEQQSFL